MDWTWEIAASPDEVHGLLLASDAAAATPDLPAPRRNPEATRALVRAGRVHLLRKDGRPAAMFTLTVDPPFALDAAGFPAAATPLYMQRLAVDPEIAASEPLVGLRALRMAIQTATDAGADVLRSEANPDLERVFAMLSGHGFVPHRAIQGGDGRRRVYLQKVLARSPS